MSKKHVKTYMMYYADTDGGGVVYHANYLKYAEQARADLLRDEGFELRGLQMNDRFGFVVKKCILDLFTPLRLDDVLRIETFITKKGKIKVNYRQNMFNDKTNESIATLECLVVGVGENPKNPVDFLPTTIPATIAEKLKSYCE